MKKFRAFLFRSRVTFWLTYVSINLVLLAGLHRLFHMRTDWFFLVGMALWVPTFYLLMQARRK